ncbi:MAG: hypothetical protein Q8R99_00885 [Methylocystis sp.]|nr:hypothetical protein [Methylocystis sp.]
MIIAPGTRIAPHAIAPAATTPIVAPLASQALIAQALIAQALIAVICFLHKTMVRLSQAPGKKLRRGNCELREPESAKRKRRDRQSIHEFSPPDMILLNIASRPIVPV